MTAPSPMPIADDPSATRRGILFVLVAMMAISVNDATIKALSGAYPLHQMVFLRSAIAILFSFVFLRLEGGLALLRTRTPGLHALRALLIVFANMTFFAGLAVLAAPRFEDGVSMDGVGVAVVVAGTLSWGVGSILLSRRPVGSVRPAVVSGWQQGFGAIGFLLMVAATSEPAPHPTPQAWGAWVYLVVFGSLLAFTSYVQALRLLPTPVVMTYTYVNPAIAVLLGWAVLGERITPSIVAGMMLILVGVWGVFRDRRARI